MCIRTITKSIRATSYNSTHHSRNTRKSEAEAGGEEPDIPNALSVEYRTPGFIDIVDKCHKSGFPSSWPTHRRALTRPMVNRRVSTTQCDHRTTVAHIMASDGPPPPSFQDARDNRIFGAEPVAMYSRKGFSNPLLTYGLGNETAKKPIGPFQWPIRGKKRGG